LKGEGAVKFMLSWGVGPSKVEGLRELRSLIRKPSMIGHEGKV